LLVAEQKHRHILEIARALLIFSSLPRSFWAKTVLTSVNLINITPSSVLYEKSPHERLYSSPPDYSMLRTLGVLALSFLGPTAPCYLPDQLSVSYSASALVPVA